MPERAETISRSRWARGDPESLLVRARQDQTHRLGRVLVSHFYMVAKTAGMFDFDNVITRDALATFRQTLEDGFALEPEITLTMAAECLFVNETRLKIDFEGFTAFKYTIEAMKGRDIGSIVFTSPVDDESLRRFLKLFVENDPRIEGARARIREGLERAGVVSIRVEEIREIPEEAAETEDDGNDYREVSINTYFKSIYVAKQFIENFRGHRSASIRKAKRLVHSVVDLVAQDETTLLALTQIKNFDHFLFTHSANVCVLSIALGQALGLPKPLLANLGLAALLHDVGMTEMPKELFQKREGLSPEERALYERHPALGARAILRSQGVSEAAIRSILVAFEHHILEDESGFPKTEMQVSRTLLGRIVGLVDFYDAVTTSDGGGGPTLAPEEALRLMVNEGRDVFDPALVKVFVNTIGTYPLGTLVRLDTGELGIVHRKSPHLSRGTRPIVKIFRDEFDRPTTPRIVDLGEWDPERNRYRRSIRESVVAAGAFADPQAFTDLV